MVTVVQLVRASDCGSECRGFESHRSPFFKSLTTLCCEGFFCLSTSSPSPSLLSARSTAVRQGSGRCPLPACPFSRVSPLLSPLCVSNGLYLIGKVPSAYLTARTRAPMPVAAENDLPRFIVVCEAGQIVSLGGEVMPRRRCVSRKDCRELSKCTFPRARERVRTPHFFVFCLHPSPACVRRSKSNRCGEGKGEGLCSPLPSPLCGSRLDCCGFWHEGRHVFDQSPLLFPHFRAVFPVRVE